MQIVRPSAILEVMPRDPGRAGDVTDDPAAFNDALARTKPDAVEPHEDHQDKPRQPDAADPLFAAWASVTASLPPITAPVATTPDAATIPAAAPETASAVEPVSPQKIDAPAPLASDTPTLPTQATHALAASQAETEPRSVTTPAAKAHDPLPSTLQVAMQKSSMDARALTPPEAQYASATTSLSPDVRPQEAVAQQPTTHPSIAPGWTAPTAAATSRSDRPAKTSADSPGNPVAAKQGDAPRDAIRLAINAATATIVSSETTEPTGQTNAVPINMSPASDYLAPNKAKAAPQATAAATAARQNPNAKSASTGNADTTSTAQTVIRKADALSAVTSLAPQISMLLPTLSDEISPQTFPSSPSSTPTLSPAFSGANAHTISQAAQAASTLPGGPARTLSAHQQLAQQIVRQVSDQGARFTMRLDPPALGRVDVRLHVGHDRSVSALISAEQPATLTELARASRELERLLEQAGLAVANDGLQFSLRQDGGATGDQGGQDFAAAPLPQNDTAQTERASTDMTKAAHVRPFGMETWRVGRVDLVA